MQTDFEHEDINAVLPGNVKQMGAPDDELRIYMEDYVHTYLYQYSRSSVNGEKLAVLMGQSIVINGQNTIFISGVIQARFTEKIKGVETITNQSWKYISEDMEKYFPNLSVVGWMHSRPSFGAFVTSMDEEYHKKLFSDPNQVLFVVDPIDRLDRLYVLNEAKSALRPVKGYFIYYEKNTQMQEYMLENSLVQPKTGFQDDELEASEGITHMDAADRIRSVLMNKQTEQVKKERNKYLIFTCVSTFFCMLCIVMSLSLVSNSTKIHRLETEVNSMRESVEVQEQKTTELAEDFSNYSPVITVMAAEGSKREENVEKEKKYYVVKEGDTLAEICRLFYGDASKLYEVAELNGIENPNVIYYGTRIELP